MLLGYAPLVGWQWVKENRRMVVTVAVMAAVMLSVFWQIGDAAADGGVVSAPAPKVAQMPEFTDLTAAFSTGNKRKLDVELIAIHHTAGSADGTVNDIAKVHFGQNHWSEVGYHFFIDKYGKVYQLHPLDERVPHAYGCNQNAIAICLAGNFSKTDVPQVQWQSALTLTRWLMQKYGLGSENVMKHSELVRYSHLNNTECAGLKFDMDKFRSEL